jgi:hypothetical protein
MGGWLWPDLRRVGRGRRRGLLVGSDLPTSHLQLPFGRSAYARHVPDRPHMHDASRFPGMGGGGPVGCNRDMADRLGPGDEGGCQASLGIRFSQAVGSRRGKGGGGAFGTSWPPRPERPVSPRTIRHRPVRVATPRGIRLDPGKALPGTYARGCLHLYLCPSLESHRPLLCGSPALLPALIPSSSQPPGIARTGALSVKAWFPSATKIRRVPFPPRSSPSLRRLGQFHEWLAPHRTTLLSRRHRGRRPPT